MYIEYEFLCPAGLFAQLRVFSLGPIEMLLLVVDDEPHVQMLLKVGLEASGEHVVVCAGSGREALDTLAETADPFDCLLLDIQMPEMDGVELCQAIRAQDAYKTTPILMLTAMSQMSYVDRAFRSGASDYVTKPFDFPVIRRRLHNLVNLAQQTEPQGEDHAFGDAKDEHAKRAELRARKLIDLSGIDRFLQAAEFDNLAKQVVLSNPGQSSAFAVKILNFEAVREALSPQKYTEMLSAIAARMSEFIQASGGFSTYRGNGVFICLEPQSARYKLSALTASLSAAVDNFAPDVTPHFVSGERVFKRLGTRADALMLMQEAAHSMSQEVRDARPVRMPPRRLLRNHLKSGLEKLFERNAYQELLYDVQDQEGNLGKSLSRRVD